MTGVITGSGLYTPPESISNDELVAAFNEYVRRWNREHAARNRRGRRAGARRVEQRVHRQGVGHPEPPRRRHARGILDPDVMRPQIRRRSDDEPSLLCEMALDAARQALEQAGRGPRDVDGVLVACSNLERPYPAIAVEVQHRARRRRLRLRPERRLRLRGVRRCRRPSTRSAAAAPAPCWY